MTRFSIVIPCYNAAATLAETLASIRAQTFTCWEALIIDDGSTDATRLLAASLISHDPRFRLMHNSGKGPAEARNMAHAHAQGEIIAFCDADDLWHPQKLELLDALFDEEPDVAACFARVGFFDGKTTGSVSKLPVGDLDIPTLLGENPVCTMSNVAIRTEAFLASGGFDTGMVHNEDLEWLIRLLGDGHRMIGLDRVLVSYRTSVSGLSADIAAMRDGRLRALATAARYGFEADDRAEAVYMRYLARRALRVGAPPLQALRLGLDGFTASPGGWFSDPRRGAMVLGGALLAPIMPRRLRQALFSR